MPDPTREMWFRVLKPIVRFLYNIHVAVRIRHLGVTFRVANCKERGNEMQLLWKEKAIPKWCCPHWYSNARRCVFLSLYYNRDLCLHAVGMSASMSGPVEVVDSPLLRQQVEVQRMAVKHLKYENIRLKVQTVFHWLTTGQVKLDKMKVNFILCSKLKTCAHCESVDQHLKVRNQDKLTALLPIPMSPKKLNKGWYISSKSSVGL